MRLFIGVELNDSLKEELVLCQRELRNSIKGKIKWVETENFHITLKFIGEASEENAQKLKNLLEEKITNFKQFVLSIKGLGFFPNNKKLNILWIGVDKGQKEIEDIFNVIEDSAKECGYKPEERTFHAHLTLGRVKKRIVFFKEFDNNMWKEREFGDMKVDKISIIKSELTNKGPKYTTYKDLFLEA